MALYNGTRSTSSLRAAVADLVLPVRGNPQLDARVGVRSDGDLASEMAAIKACGLWLAFAKLLRRPAFRPATPPEASGEEGPRSEGEAPRASLTESLRHSGVCGHSGV